MNPHLSFLQRICLIGVPVLFCGVTATAGNPDSLEPIPEIDEPVAAPAKPATVQEITPIREQNAVTSVRVKRGGNIYYVTPSEQFAEINGGRAAQWEIFEFRSKARDDAGSRAAPPPPSTH